MMTYHLLFSATARPTQRNVHPSSRSNEWSPNKNKMLLPIPALNTSSPSIALFGPCQAVFDLNAVRPPGSEVYHLLHIILPSIIAALFLCIIPGLFYLRNVPVFYRIRPFALLCTLNLCFVVYSVVTLLAEANLAPFSCGLLLVVHGVGITITVSVLYARILLFVAETRTHQLLLLREEPSVVVVATDYASTLLLAIKLGLWLTPVETIKLAEWNNMRRKSLFLICAASLPSVIAIVGGMIAFPIYNSGCVDCPVFTEFVLLITLPPTLTVLMIANLRRIARKLHQDDHGVLQEFSLLWYMYILPGIGGYLILHLVDPREISFERQFNPQIIIAFVVGINMWIISFFMPITRALIYCNKRRAGNVVLRHVTNNHSFTFPFANNAEFYLFACKRLCMENLNFLDDYREYKLECNLGFQPQRWLQIAAMQIINTYIRDGAEQEINISAPNKQAILERSKNDAEALDFQELATLFDCAGEEVLEIILHGVWVDFQNSVSLSTKRQRKALVLVE